MCMRWAEDVVQTEITNTDHTVVGIPQWKGSLNKYRLLFVTVHNNPDIYRIRRRNLAVLKQKELTRKKTFTQFILTKWNTHQLIIYTLRAFLKIMPLRWLHLCVHSCAVERKFSLTSPPVFLQFLLLTFCSNSVTTVEHIRGPLNLHKGLNFRPSSNATVQRLSNSDTRIRKFFRQIS